MAQWDLNSRTKLLDYAEKNGIPIAKNKRQEAPYSMDANLLHISYEGLALEDPWVEYTEDMFTRSVAPENAPDTPRTLEIEFEKGDPVAINGERMSPAAMLTALNKYGGDNGIGSPRHRRVPICGHEVSRGVRNPGGTLLLHARRGIESICLDRGESHLKDELMPRYASSSTTGSGSPPEREMLQAAIDRCAENVNGTVRVKLYKGNVDVVGRKSAQSLYNANIASFEDDGGAYDQKDAAGFIQAQRPSTPDAGHPARGSGDDDE